MGFGFSSLSNAGHLKTIELVLKDFRSLLPLHLLEIYPRVVIQWWHFLLAILS